MIEFMQGFIAGSFLLIASFLMGVMLFQFAKTIYWNIRGYFREREEKINDNRNHNSKK